jgi:hypothetical protein
MTQTPVPPRSRRGRDVMDLLARVRPASLDPAAERVSAVRASVESAAFETAELGDGAGPLPHAQLSEQGSRTLPGLPSWQRGPVLGRFARPRLWAAVAAAAAVAAVVIIATTLAPFGAGQRRNSSNASWPTAAAALDQAASAAAGQPAGYGRYFVSEVESVEGGLFQYPTLAEYWTGDGVPGWLVTPPAPGRSEPGPADEIRFGNTYLSWAKVQDLPTEPGRLLSDIAKVSSYSGMPRSANTEFETITILLESAPAPPALRSALFRVAAMLPGLTVVSHVRDLIGRDATEVYVPGAGLEAWRAMLFDPATSAVLGDVVVLPTSNPSPIPASCRNLEEALIAQGYVGSPGQLPPGAPHTVLPVVLPALIPQCTARRFQPTSAPSATPARTTSPGPTPSSSPSPTPTVSPSPSSTLSPSPTLSPTPESPSPASSSTPSSPASR